MAFTDDIIGIAKCNCYLVRVVILSMATEISDVCRLRVTILSEEIEGLTTFNKSVYTEK